jgi:hypothetical protein
MRHNKKLNHLSRKTAHRKSMLSNMATSLIMHKRIFTTTAKAQVRFYNNASCRKMSFDAVLLTEDGKMGLLKAEP